MALVANLSNFLGEDCDKVTFKSISSFELEGQGLGRSPQLSDGFIARIFDTAMHWVERWAAAAMVSTNARHSFAPVASNSRKERMRETDHSIPATTTVGLLSNHTFPDG